MRPDTALRDKHVWEVDAAQPSLGWIPPHPVCGLIHCGTCIIPSSVSLTPVLILRFSHLPKEAFTESPKPVIFLISLDIRLKKLIDERECLLEQVTIFFITFQVLEWETWNWDPPHSSLGLLTFYSVFSTAFLLALFYLFIVLTKKDVLLENCELSFIWGKIRTAAREAASQIALRDCSKQAVGKVNI